LREGDIILERKDHVLAVNEQKLTIEGDSTFVEAKVGDKA